MVQRCKQHTRRHTILNELQINIVQTCKKRPAQFPDWAKFSPLLSVGHLNWAEMRLQALDLFIPIQSVCDSNLRQIFRNAMNFLS